MIILNVTEIIVTAEMIDCFYKYIPLYRFILIQIILITTRIGVNLLNIIIIFRHIDNYLVYC